MIFNKLSIIEKFFKKSVNKIIFPIIYLWRYFYDKKNISDPII